MPDMGTRKANHRISEAAAAYANASLSGALFTSTQRRVLACLFGENDRGYTVSELKHVTGAGSGAVQRELAKLTGSGLVTVEPVGNQKMYRANQASPIHDELRAIVRKTFGLAAPLREALAPLADHIRAAFIYGSHAKRADTAGSDIDLMIVSESLGYPEVMAALHPVIERLGREINPTVYTPGEMHRRLKSGTAFTTRVLQQPKLWLIGSDHDLGA